MNGHFIFEVARGRVNGRAELALRETGDGVGSGERSVGERFVGGGA